MTEPKVRWGILAPGGIAEKFAADLALVEGAELAAVGSRSRASAEAFAERFGFARAHGSYAELAADDEVDVVYVATPHAMHFDAALLCLEGGKAVPGREADHARHGLGGPAGGGRPRRRASS